VSLERADAILEEAIVLFDGLNDGHMEYRMARNRIEHLCRRHLQINAVIPKPQNKVGFHLLKNGLFCLLHILIFGQDPETKARLYEYFDGHVEYFRAEFL
jgi:hypothetical protein